MCFIGVGKYTMFLLFILHLLSHHANADYTIITNGKTWKYASQSCTLIGSGRDPSYAVDVQDISYPTDMDDSPHWIGATADITPWFEFTGCYVYDAIVEKEIIMLSGSRARSIGPVAECYLQCESHFGVDETHCYCTRDIEKKRLNGTCDLIKSTSFENDVIADNTHENIDKKYMFAMYKLHDSTLKIKDNLDECLVDTNTDFMSYPCDSVDSSMRTWSDAIIQGLTSDNNNRRQWTSFVRRRIMQWTKGTSQTKSNCVSVKGKTTKKNYELVVRPCDDILPYICQNETEDNDWFTFLMILLVVCIATLVVGAIAAALNSDDDDGAQVARQSASGQRNMNTQNGDNQAMEQRGGQQSTSNEQASGSTIKSAEDEKEGGSDDSDKWDPPSPDGIM